MNDLATLRKFCSLLSKAAKWKNSNDAILNVEMIKSSNRKEESIFEFFCAMRILLDLKDNYSITIENNKTTNRFPKGPSLKKNFPYFAIRNKDDNSILFQVCLGTQIKGVTDEKYAPDISFQRASASLNPNYEDVSMIYDAKFKHKLSASVTDSEFAKVFFMVIHLKCENAESNSLNVSFDKFKSFIGNCIISNGKPYKTASKIHQQSFLKEIVEFGIDDKYKVYG